MLIESAFIIFNSRCIMKKLFLILLVLCLSFSLFACESDSDSHTDLDPDSDAYSDTDSYDSHFVELSSGLGYQIVYSSFNGVIYFADVSYQLLHGTNRIIENLCPLFNPDGSLMVYPDDWSLSDVD